MPNILRKLFFYQSRDKMREIYKQEIQRRVGMWKEFKEFVLKGNVMSLAIGIIIGAAFTAIVTSLVDDILMPVVGIITGGIDFAALHVVVGSATLSYGAFIGAVINFILIALVVFFMVKGINKVYRKKEEKQEARKCMYCFQEVDELATRCQHCTSVLRTV